MYYLKNLVSFFEKVVKSQLRFACSKLTIETWENCVKYVQ